MAKTPHYDEKRMELTEHLAELRMRIIRSLFYVLVGAILAYQVFTPIYNFLYQPLAKQIDRLDKQRIIANTTSANKIVFGSDGHIYLPPLHNPPTYQDIENLRELVIWGLQHPGQKPVIGDVFRNFHEMFLVRLKLSLLFGFILVIPFVLWEAAAFVLPALTPQERRPLRLMFPISVFLLLFGVVVAYITMFYAMGWFLSYLSDFPPGATLMQDPNDYIVFMVKMMAAFGVAFQLPVVLMAGTYLGIVNSKSLIKQWRWGVLIAVVGGLLTPSNDIISWTLMVIPLLVLYFGSYFLVRLVEWIKIRDQARAARSHQPRPGTA
ncbi:Sec-independent protein secretion pathway component TatC [Chthonomonas calidirosea]|uniref:twin-arginine translocase subunit TatC n=1 Tax=Chthonomonas calidirosea TaxID=454171 RepID=UPI0006DD5069|nr:twin-arginine translocase subunit TatC [Chthonomonas calidirosea]CEK15776.1 Sec-independent protein secretion pathway component TatC [Chthonomonas calidirosea]